MKSKKNERGNIMKKISIILACCVLALSLSACGNESKTETSTTEKNESSESVVIDENNNSVKNTYVNEEKIIDSTSTTAKNKNDAEVFGENTMIKDYLGKAPKAVTEFLGNDYEITDGYGGSQIFISYKETNEGGWGTLPYNFGVYSETADTQDEVFETGKVVSVVTKIKYPDKINDRFNTMDTYAQLKEKTGLTAVPNEMEGGYTLSYVDGDLSIAFCWENEPADGEHAETLFVSAT